MSIRDIDEYYKKIEENNILIFEKLKINKYLVDDTNYEDKEFLIQDPDGYLLRFNN